MINLKFQAVFKKNLKGVYCLFILFIVFTGICACNNIQHPKDNSTKAKITSLLQEPKYDEQGFLNYSYHGKTYKLWYGKIGKGTKPPVIILHGGPGSNHYCLAAFKALAIDRPVYFYDQLGCGKSDRPNDPSLWTAKRFFYELKFVRNALRLKQYHLVGFSWGTTLAIGFAASNPDGILSISLHGPILSFPYYSKYIVPVIKQRLGNNAQTIDNYELQKTGTKEEYEKACSIFEKLYFMRSYPPPKIMEKTFSMFNNQMHKVMVGSQSELNLRGNLKQLDLTGKLSKLNIPILMSCGEYDMLPYNFMEWQASFAKHPELKIITHSAHMTPIDNPEELINDQKKFFQEHNF